MCKLIYPLIRLIAPIFYFYFLLFLLPFKVPSGMENIKQEIKCDVTLITLNRLTFQLFLSTNT